MDKKVDNCYKYNSIGQLSKDCFASFDEYLKPFFESFKLDIKTFIIQVIDLVLVFILSYFIFGDLIGSLIKNIRGSANMGIKILLIFIIMCAISALSKNKIFRWQTIFEINYKLAKIFLFSLITINNFAYCVKYNIFSYERSKK